MVLRENDLAIFCRKTDNKLTTRIGGEGVAEQSPLDPIIDSCPDKNFHNCDFGRKFEKTQGLDDALRRWLGTADLPPILPLHKIHSFFLGRHGKFGLGVRDGV